jgi:predicted Zn-ribbon and HTH transcriptional regulator
MDAISAPTLEALFAHSKMQRIKRLVRGSKELQVIPHAARRCGFVVLTI